MWLCAVEADVNRISLTLSVIGTDQLPTPLDRRSWRVPVKPDLVLSQLARWQAVYAIHLDRIVVDPDLDLVPLDLVHALRNNYHPLIKVDPEELRDVMQAWRRREAPRWRRAEWMCLLGSSSERPGACPYTWVLARLRSQVQALETFLRVDAELEREGEMVFIRWDR